MFPLPAEWAVRIIKLTHWVWGLIPSTTTLAFFQIFDYAKLFLDLGLMNMLFSLLEILLPGKILFLPPWQNSIHLQVSV